MVVRVVDNWVFVLLINRVNIACCIIIEKKLFLLWKELDLALNPSACNNTYITLSKPKLSRYKLQRKDFYILSAYSHTQIWIVSLP